MNRPKMVCPKCGADMNQHAEKIDCSAALKNPGAGDPHLGGVVEEFHTCPVCGANASRRAAQ